MKNNHKLILILIIWLFLMVTVVTVSLKTVVREKDASYDQMIEASLLTEKAFNKIKEYKINHDIEIPSYDKLQTGMIGSNKRTSITTTEGILEAKRTVTNPSWAALLIKIFVQCGLKENDEIGMVFSGSFPSLNIATMVAAEVYGLKVCIMCSVGASYYGANDPNFTFFDMAMYLYNEGILHNKIDYVSLGGADDIAYDFRSDEDTENIIKRINEANVPLIYEEDFDTNIKLRLNYFEEKVPNIRLFINVGGSMVGFGQGLTAFTSSGLFRSVSQAKIKNTENKNYGLIQRMLQQNVDVFSFINIKDLSEKYGLTYDPDTIIEKGVEDVYYHNKYSNWLLISALILSIGLGILFYCLRKQEKKEKNIKARNYLINK